MLLLAQKQYTVYVTRTTAGFQICVQDNTGVLCNFKLLRLCFYNGFDDLNIKISQSRHLPMLGRPK